MTTEPDQKAHRRQQPGNFQIGKALRFIRTRRGLTQTAASKFPGAPDFRTLSHWETARKLPSLQLLRNYLAALGLDFADLQEALDQVQGQATAVGLAARCTALERHGAAFVLRIIELEERMTAIEAAGR